MPSSKLDMNQHQRLLLHMPPPLPQRHQPRRPVSALSAPPPERPLPRNRRPKSHCVALLPQESSFTNVQSFDRCPVTKRPTRSFEDTKLRIPDARQRMIYLENQCKCYAKADSDMIKWVKRVSAKGPPTPVLEGYMPSRRQSASSTEDLSIQSRNCYTSSNSSISSSSSSSSNSSSNNNNTNTIRPQPNASFSTTLTTFLRKAASGSVSSNTRRSPSGTHETPRPSLSRMFRPSYIGRLSISVSTKPKEIITKEKKDSKIVPPTTIAATTPAHLYSKPEPSSLSKTQHQSLSKRWQPASVMGSLRIPSSTKSESTRRQVSLVTASDRRVLSFQTKNTDWRQAKKMTESPTGSSQSLAHRKRTVAPSLAPMYISTAWR